jgi:hypothetical protein
MDGSPGRDRGDSSAEQAAGQHADTNDDRGQRQAETRTREEYADAMRANGHQDAPATTALLTHFRGEFKDRRLDLYTDGARWAAADTSRTQDNGVGEVKIPDVLPNLLPTGEELVDSAGEDSSRLERLRHDIYEESDDEIDVLEKDANLVHDVFSHPPTSSYEGTPTQPHIYRTPHPGIDGGSTVTALFTLGLVIDRAVHWAVGYYDKHAKGR